MAMIKPFCALRFTEGAGRPSELVCPPYDIVGEPERRALLERNPHNLIRLELPREGEDPYALAGGLLEDWRGQGTLACDPSPALYVYEEEFHVDGMVRRIKGLVCRVRLEEFETGVILPHEETLSKAKEDRFRLMCATRCSFSSIYSLYFDPEQRIYPAVDAFSRREPDQAVATGDGVTHRLWICTDRERIGQVCALLGDSKLYIADGHHRYETALRYRDHLRALGETVDDSHPANYIMMTLVNMEHPGLVVFPTHRIVRGLPAFDPKALLKGCSEYFAVGEVDSREELETALARAGAERRTAFALYAGGRFRLLLLRESAASVMAELLPGASEPYRELDVNVLHSLILERMLGIDKENMANQKNLIYTRDPQEAIDLVDSAEANCAFLINATRVDEIAAVAGAGEKMPQKSTYFYPKLITGLAMNDLTSPVE